VKPLIEDETNFLKHSEDFITVNKDIEDGFLEETLEKFVRKSGFGNQVGAPLPNIKNTC